MVVPILLLALTIAVTLELARLWLNRVLKLFRLEAEYCRDLDLCNGAGGSSDSKKVVWSNGAVRDLPSTCCSWRIVTGINNRDGGGGNGGRDGAAVVAAVAVVAVVGVGAITVGLEIVRGVSVSV